MMNPVQFLPIGLLLLLGGCATMPSGPSIMVLPGAGKNFEQFRADEYACRQYAHDSVAGINPNQTGVESAVVGTAVGALAGAVIGGNRGAGVGAGDGLIVGSAVGSQNAQMSGYDMQRQYNNTYLQCMYAKGNQVPVNGRFSRQQRMNDLSPPPPPPPGMPPPPPPGY
ncbi:glycine zipper family protein [Halothiobacillus sp.]|uniref:glycine zipper family protein n=1 Tax=Halothiobacillus sp. TaxID=1891311 RepID=UPI002AD1DB5E|nr:glycine zipper family protein [Halothiobacillus sp.]